MSTSPMGANKPIEDIEATLLAATKSALDELVWRAHATCNDVDWCNIHRAVRRVRKRRWQRSHQRPGTRECMASPKTRSFPNVSFIEHERQLFLRFGIGKSRNRDSNQPDGLGRRHQLLQQFESQAREIARGVDQVD
jgi:hypothetical protein